MGRHHVKIELIEDERMRQVMFLKRKQIINRKLYELAVVCGCEISCIYFTSDAKMWEFSSTGNTDEILMRYADYSSPHEIRSIADYERLNGEDPAISEYDVTPNDTKDSHPPFPQSNFIPDEQMQITRPMPLPIDTSLIQNVQWSNSKHFLSPNALEYVQESPICPISGRSDMATETGSLTRKRGLLLNRSVPSSAHASSFPNPIFSPSPFGNIPKRFGSNSYDQFHPPTQQESRKDISLSVSSKMNFNRTVIPPPPTIRRRSSVPGSEWPPKTPPSSENNNTPTYSHPLPIYSPNYHASPTDDFSQLSPKRLKLNAIYNMLTPPRSANDEINNKAVAPPIFLEPNLRISPLTSMFSWK